LLSPLLLLVTKLYAYVMEITFLLKHLLLLVLILQKRLSLPNGKNIAVLTDFKIAILIGERQLIKFLILLDMAICFLEFTASIHDVKSSWQPSVDLVLCHIHVFTCAKGMHFCNEHIFLIGSFYNNLNHEIKIVNIIQLLVDFDT